MPVHINNSCFFEIVKNLFAALVCRIGTLISISLILVSTAVNARNICFEAQGFITISNSALQNLYNEKFELQGKAVHLNAKALNSHFCDFSVAVSNDFSLIRVKYFNNESFVCGTDGRDSYLLNEMTAAKERDASVAEFGYVSSGPFPSKALTPIQIIWLAFASASYLKGTNLELNLEAFHENGHLFKPEVQAFHSDFPSDIRWKAPGFNPAVRGEQVGLPAYPNGRIAGRFTVTAITNFETFQIPAAFTLVLFAPREGGNDRNPEDGISFEVLGGVVTNIFPLRYSGDFLPELSGKATVQEFRFKKELGYGIALAPTQGKWPRSTDPAHVQLLNKYRQSHAVTVPEKSKMRFRIRVVWASVTLLTMLFAFLSLKVKNKKEAKRKYDEEKNY